MYLKDRCDYLTNLCGLKVTAEPHKKTGGVNVFIFWKDGKHVTSFNTYYKAKAFANGVRFGIETQRHVM